MMENVDNSRRKNEGGKDDMPAVQRVESQLERGRAALQEISMHLQGLENALKTLDAIRVPARADLVGDVMVLLESTYGEFTARLASGDSSERRARALLDIEESADGDYY